jgi:hypothetical protein
MSRHVKDIEEIVVAFLSFHVDTGITPWTTR